MNPSSLFRPITRGNRLSLLAGIGLVAATSGCGMLLSLAGRNTVDLKGATVKTMTVKLRKEAPTLCPGEKAQLHVMLDATLKGESAPKTYETYSGGEEANQNGKLDFAAFTFSSGQAEVGPHGFLIASPRAKDSLAKGFILKSMYSADVGGATVMTELKPNYDCIKVAKLGGKAGAPGTTGEAGVAGRDGAGGDGGAGQAGGAGADGGRGPNVKVFATMVKTPFYDKLIALRIEGSESDLVLAPATSVLQVSARGGAGGAGGEGGSGGRGGRGAFGSSGAPGSPGGRGAAGGPGGNGGSGGAGGDLELVVDATFPELGDLIRVDASGGEAGAPGHGGSGGSPGDGGQGRGGAFAPKGTAGTHGPNGAAGHAGPAGTTRVSRGFVASQFAGIEGLEPLSQTSGIVASTAPIAVKSTKGGRKR